MDLMEALSNLKGFVESGAAATIAAVLVTLVTRWIPRWQKQAREERMQMLAAAAKDREIFSETLSTQTERFAETIDGLAAEIRETRKELASEMRSTRSEVSTAIRDLQREVHNQSK